MQSIRHYLTKCSFLNQTVLQVEKKTAFDISRTLSCSAPCREDTNWLRWNKKEYPIREPNEEKRLAYVCHVKKDIQCSPKKMWYIACFVRGMSIDEAIKQLSFLGKQAAASAKATLLEAQELAIQHHNVEFKSNLWVAESFVGKGIYVRGLRKNAKRRFGTIRYKYCHYFVRLEEGKPPKNYYAPAPKEGREMLDDWLRQMRSRKIPNTL